MAQKHIIRRCNEIGIPVVTATQMLDSMIHNPRPTRAETSDVANAILDGTDAVMLSGETAAGAYPLESVQTMVRIICEVEGSKAVDFVPPYRPSKESTNLSIARAIASSARDAADNLDTTAIIAITASGYTARIVSQYRPHSPIIAVAPDSRVVRQLMLYRGVTPLLAERSHNTDEMIANAIMIASEMKLIKRGDKVVITAGTAGSEPGTTNFMQIRIIQ
jgi:pyruvate kinase